MGLIPMFLSVPGERYEYEMNVLLACTRQGVPILEEEIRAIYVNGNAASHFDVLRDSCRIYKEILKFMLSSFLGFLIDYTAYALLLFFTSDLWFSNIAARIVSASANYAVNRRFVFGSRGGAVKPAMQYAALAALILAANTLLLGYLAESCGISRMLAKIVTELICFTVSWTVQKAVIFRKDVRRQP